MSGRVRGLTAPLAALTLALAGCGGSSSHASSSSVAASHASATTASSTTSTTTAATSHHTPAKHHEPATSSSTASSSASATTSGTTQTAPSPTPTGTLSAPPGLAKTTGYGTYELCAGTCTGAVPSSLRRSLQLLVPGTCPMREAGPVQPTGSMVIHLQKFLGSSWLGAQVNWTAADSYSGPVLIRGREAGGPGAVGFGEGHEPYDELQLLDSGQEAPPHPAGTRAWLTLIRVKEPGCYGFRIDTTRGSSAVYLKTTG